jgi:hypothetical protein
VVTAWLGNTPRIALKHYLQTTDADFDRAAQGGADSGAPAAQNEAQQPSARIRKDLQETTQAPGVPRAYAKSFGALRRIATIASGEDRKLKTPFRNLFKINALSL